MDNLNLVTDQVVVNKIYEIRGQKVMLDSDLAELYGVETKRINEQVSRNLTRFPPDFMYQLTNDEWVILKSQFATSRWGGRRKLPFVFTEHGVLMLSSVLSSEKAIQVNIEIVRVFNKIRRIIVEGTETDRKIAEIQKRLKNHDKSIELVFTYVDELSEKNKPRRRIGFMPDDLTANS